MVPMHGYTPETERLAQAIVGYALERIRMDPPPLDGPRTLAELLDDVGSTVTPAGVGGDEALRIWVEQLAPACISQDHPRALSFVPTAPTKTSVLFDLVVGASSIYGGSWLEGGGAVFAENQALRWIADLAGLPADAGGCFVQGGSAGNLSALVAARHRAQEARRGSRPARWVVAASEEVHASIDAAARVMDVEVLVTPADDIGRLTGPALASTIAGADPTQRDGLFAVVATAGTTNLGIVDDLAGVARVCAEVGVWMHVDGAYGGAALAAPSVRGLFDGIEQADSLVVDPHKWLFAPFDCAALLYRDPAIARAAHTQRAGYLDVLTETDDWNPSDYAYHLTRRARGLPLWFSLATHGTDAYRDAVETTLRTTRLGADLVRSATHVELVVEPQLSVLTYRRLGWDADDYARWSDRVLADELTLSVPSSWRDQPFMRACIVNPRTTIEDLELVIDSMAGAP